MSQRPVGPMGPDGPAGSDGTHGSGQTPQDAPLWAPPLAAPTPAGPSGPDTSVSVPRPAGPNWGLTLFGLLLMGVASAVVFQQVTGVDPRSFQAHGPLLLVGVGVACALVGVVGMVRRRT